jgi:hypothetical protein
MSKTEVSFPALTGDGSGIELLANAIRQNSSGEDAYRSKTTFKAVVLKPIGGAAMSPKDKAAREGSPEPVSKQNSRGGFFAYRVRIIDENSPHLFLPDPCNPQVAKKNSAASNVIKDMHTLAFSREQLNYGDEVVITLTPGNFSYNIEQAYITEILQNNAQRYKADKKCSQARDLFNQAVSTSEPPKPVSAYQKTAAPPNPLPALPPPPCDFDDTSKWRLTEFDGIKIYSNINVAWTSNFSNAMINYLRYLKKESSRWYQYFKTHTKIIYTDDTWGPMAGATFVCDQGAMVVGEGQFSKQENPSQYDYIWSLSVLIHEAEHLETWGETSDAARTQSELTAIHKQVQFLESIKNNRGTGLLNFKGASWRDDVLQHIKNLEKEDGEHWKDESRNQARAQHIKKRDQGGA